MCYMSCGYLQTAMTHNLLHFLTLETVWLCLERMFQKCLAEAEGFCFDLTLFLARLEVWGGLPCEKCRSDYPYKSHHSYSLHIGPSLCSMYCTSTLIGCPAREDIQEVKELRALFGFTRGQMIVRGWIWNICICLIQLSLRLFVIRDF